VVKASGLVPDLAQLAAGGHTEVSANGVNLSGSQTARLCLARACYADADVVILDSPLAAIDAVVQAESFSLCLCTLLEAKTVVLVTHAPDVIASDAVDCSLEVVEGHVSSTRCNRAKPRHAWAPPVDEVVGNSVEHSLRETTSSHENRLVDDEKREEGRVLKAIFMQYLNALGGVRATVISWVSCRRGRRRRSRATCG
jgi:ATP-binding cassette, subfamily C (CFTR/MRP), member 1